MHIFKFSPRKGTRAAEMKEQVDGLAKEERSGKLIKLSNELEKEFMEKYIGTTMKVLYEQVHDSNRYEGYTSNYVKVLSESTVDVEGEILETVINDCEKDYLLGKLL